ncbi:hypothetical protein [Myxosarcina sp. GI1]|uniref:hypothetical protein n=1 Tax=Myxosarcina sp. GI1 TaxID=1541065 RepID=UPI00055B8E96|nr:hypothetical protein [Myxosarcina sp. GI1]
MLAKFRHHYPQGSIVSELLDLDRGLYLVKVSVRVSGELLATGLAAAERVELAEDRARERAIAALALDTVDTVAVAAQSTKTDTETDYKPTNPERSVVPSEPANKRAETAADYPVEEPAVTQQLSDTTTGIDNFQQADSSELQSDLPAPAIAETPVTNGSLFEGTYESQSPISALDLEPPREDLTTDIEPGLPEEQPIEVNFEDIKHQTDIHIKRLGWTREDGVNFLKSRYGKRSRLHLKDEELLEFLHYLESQPTPK